MHLREFPTNALFRFSMFCQVAWSFGLKLHYLRTNITIRIGGGIIQIPIESAGISAIIPITAKFSNTIPKSKQPI